jgi:hypothetical protein
VDGLNKQVTLAKNVKGFGSAPLVEHFMGK